MDTVKGVTVARRGHGLSNPSDMELLYQEKAEEKVLVAGRVSGNEC